MLNDFHMVLDVEPGSEKRCLLATRLLDLVRIIPMLTEH